RSQGDGSVKRRVFSRLSYNCCIVSLRTQYRHRHCAIDRRSTRCLGFLELFLSLLHALEYFACAANLRRIVNSRPSARLLSDCRLLRVTFSDGVAGLHLLEQRRGSRSESLGSVARRGDVGDPHCRNRVCGFSIGALGVSEGMELFARATGVVWQPRLRDPLDVCSNAGRTLVLHLLPIALGSLGY